MPFLDEHWCAGCCVYIGNARETGVSGLYFPGDNGILLCMACYDSEEALVDDTGKNDHPALLAHYKRNLAKMQERHG